MEKQVDLGLQRSLRRKTFRRRAVMAVAVLVFIETAGVPAVRLSEAKPGHTVRYFTVEGERSVRPSEPRPLVCLVPLRQSLLARLSGLFEEVAGG